MDSLKNRPNVDGSVSCPNTTSREFKLHTESVWILLAFSVMMSGLPALTVAQEENGVGQGTPWVKYIEAGADFTHFTNDYGEGNNQFLAISFSKEWCNLIRFDFGRSERFKDVGVGVGASFTQYLVRKWSIRIGANTGSGEFILPRYRLSTSIGRSFLSDGKLQAEIGYIHDQSKGENYFDRIAASINWYTGPHWILGGFFNYDMGQPGNTRTNSGGVGVTWFTWRERYFGGTVEYGDVNYVQVGLTNYLVSFTETLVKVHYTEYLNPKAGLNFRLDLGSNDFYNITGFSASIFKEW
jgi:YaiO family outer membrane protein